ncbi:MAG: hypothetical protein V4757_19905 [Pseudomonadota bacterium]
MRSRRLAAAVLVLASALLAACPDPRGPKVPTTPKVPEPKAWTAPQVLAHASLFDFY